ncbi:MAG: PKD domain-containing protein [Crocinitomicaceae bacterium]
MKWIYTIVSCLVLLTITTNLHASHASGAQLTYECLGGNQYLIRLKFYRDCSGVSVTASPTVNYDGCGGSGSISLTQVNLTEVTPLCPTASSVCDGGSVTGYEEYTFEATVTLPANCTNWHFTFCENARNGIIDVINSPDLQDLCVEAYLNNLDAPCNSSPDFTNAPVSFLCANTPYCMNPGALDPDGDSLVYTMITPLNNASGGTVTYIAPYGPNNPLPTTAGGPFTLNTQTGDICFTASGPIVSVMAVRVDQYNSSGVWVGSVIRDIQVNVSNCTNENPELLGFDGSPIAPDGSNVSLEICPGTSVSQVINATDPNDPGNVLTITWNSSIPGASFVDNGDGTASFNWTPGPGDIGTTQCFTVMVQDDQCPYVGSTTNSYCITINGGTVLGTSDTIQVCGNLQANLSVNNGTTFTWSVLNGDPINVPANFSCNPCQNPVATPSITTTYIVTSDLTGAGVCGNKDTVTVEVLPNLGDLTVDAGPDQNICAGQCVDLQGTAVQVTPPAGPVTFSANPNAYIDDNTPVNSTINVSGLTMTNISAGSIESVCLNINHGAAGELDIFLECPDGTIFELTTDNGGTNNNYVGTCFTVSAVNPITGGSAPFSGNFVPEGGPLGNAFVGCSANGNWTLHVTDDTGDYNCFLFFCDNDDGTVLDWSITFNDEPDTNFLTTSWSPGGDMNDPSLQVPNVCPSSTGAIVYTITGTDANGCTETDDVTVNVSTSFALNAAITDVSCAGMDGEIDLTPAGGTPPYIYQWVAVPSGTNMGSTQDLTGLATGDYEITVTDQNGTGCVSVDTFTVGSALNVPAIDSVTIVDESCFGLNDGSIEVHISGGTGSPTVTLLQGAVQIAQNGTGIFPNLAPGTYDIEVDDGGCVVTSQAIVKAGPNINFTFSTVQATCGASNGSIEINATGGSGYEFSITGGAPTQTDSIFNNLSAGAYSGYVIDVASGCEYSQAINVTNVSSQTIVSVDSSATSCNGLCDGSFTVHMSGGVTPINFSIDNGTTTQTDSTFSGLCAGVYDIWTEDQTGCVATTQVTIDEPAPISFMADSTDASCNGVCDGEIQIHNVLGGDGTYNFTISNGAAVGPQADSLFVGLCAGNYSLTVEDGNGCTSNGIINVVEPIALNLVFHTADAVCNGDCDGYAEANISGGIAPYSFVWTAGLNIQNDSTIIDVCAGTYDLTVTDNNGCTIDTLGFAISENPPMQIQNVVIADEVCSGSCDGSITVNAATATQFSTDGGQNYQAGNVFNNMCPGNYDIYVLDADGCQHDTNVTVGSINPINIQTVSDTTICITGAADLSALAQGGTGVFDYTWTEIGSGPIATTSNSININPTVTTTYEVFATDIPNGCTSPTATITVNVNPPLNAQAFTSQTICQGESVNIWGTANGGDGNLVYTWTTNFSDTLNGTTQNGLTPVQTTTYTLGVTDGCGTPPSYAAVTITVNPTPVVTFSTPDSATCIPSTFNLVNQTLVQGSCFWQFGNGTSSTNCNPQVTINSPGCYSATLTVTTPEGCVSDTTIVDYLCGYPYPTASFLHEPQVPTTAYTHVSFENLSEDATTYLWDFGDGQGSNEENPVHVFPDEEAGEYPIYLIAINEYGCTDTAYSKVIIRDEFIMYVPNAFTPDNDDFNETFKPIMTSGFNPYSYELLIFNRWGELIFESHNSDVGWNGTFQGNIVQDGVYVWKISLKDSFTDEKKVFQGHVTLIR